jgi:hypothetical protein
MPYEHAKPETPAEMAVALALVILTLCALVAFIWA